MKCTNILLNVVRKNRILIFSFGSFLFFFLHCICIAFAHYCIIYSHHSTPITPTTIESERISSFGKLKGGNSDLFTFYPCFVRLSMIANKRSICSLLFRAMACSCASASINLSISLLDPLTVTCSPLMLSPFSLYWSPP